ncbi:MAG: alpha-L-rhamnosidase C-terminal domain-containing protein, partial [Bacteroidales bacterium]
LQAMALAGNYRGALDIIRQYWGGMLSLGATTFWEDFDIDWLKNGARIDELPSGNKIDVHREYGDHCYKGYRHSLCHGWSAGPTPWLSEYVLGIKVIEPGCRKVRIRPCLGDLDWAEGTYPTPYGAIYVRHEKDKHGNVKSIIKSPKEVTVVR